MSERIWFCKIGGDLPHLPDGADNPLRRAVREAFLRTTGHEDAFCVSGWGGTLTETERVVVSGASAPTGSGNPDPFADVQAIFAERHYLGSPMVGNRAGDNIVMVKRDWYNRLRAALSPSRETPPQERSEP